jgi:hypothetical protein
MTERRGGGLYRSDDGGLTWSAPLLVGSGEGTQFAYSSLSYLPGSSDGVGRAGDRIGLSYETWAPGCKPYAPACAVEFVTLPTVW